MAGASGLQDATQGADDAAQALRYVQKLDRAVAGAARKGLKVLRPLMGRQAREESADLFGKKAARLFVRQKENMVKVLGASDETEKLTKDLYGFAIGSMRNSATSFLRNKVLNLQFASELLGDAFGNVTGEIVSQGIAIGTGDRGDFDWNQIGLAALSALSAPTPGTKLGAMADAEAEVLHDVQSQIASKAAAKKAAKVVQSSMSMPGKDTLKKIANAMNKTYSGAALLIIMEKGQKLGSTAAQEFGSGFAKGLITSSIYQGAQMALGEQESFDVDAMLRYSIGSGAGTLMRGGVLKTGKKMVGGSTERMDTRSFDMARIAATVVGSAAAMAVYNGSNMDAILAQAGDVQNSIVGDAAMMGNMRIGRS